MSKQPPPNVNMPNRSHTYYPIQPKKKSPEEVAPQHTLRVDRIREREVDTLRKAYNELKEREEIYIDKLMKLQQGLENQHSQFVKLQELYTQLFQSYKQKQSQIIELEMKFRESDRYRQQEREGEKAKESNGFCDSRAKQYSFREKEWSCREGQLQLKEREWTNREHEWIQKEKQLTQYIEKLNKKIIVLTESYERLTQQLSFYKGKQKISSSKILAQHGINQIQQWQKQVNMQRESRLKFQYENQFLKSRNADLEIQREQLEKLLAYKQKQINKLRQEKIKIHRKSSEKSIQKSPVKPQIKSNTKTAQISIDNHSEKRRDMAESEAKPSNVDGEKQKYFSFSRDRHNLSVDSELPSFPPELQIDSLITEHKK